MRRLLLALSLLSPALTNQMGDKDVCAGTPCGKGATCRAMRNIAVCICPDHSHGDPFVECKESTDKTTTSTSPSPSYVTRVYSNNNNYNNRYDHGSDYITNIRVESEYDRNRPTSHRNDHTSPYYQPTTTHSTTNSYAPYQHQSTTNRNHHNYHNNQQIITHRYEDDYRDNKNELRRSDDNKQSTRDPMGQYNHCRQINGIMVCTENSVDGGDEERRPSSNIPYNSFEQKRGEIYKDEIREPQRNHHTNQYTDSHTNKYTDSHNKKDQDESCMRYCGENAVCRSLLGRAVCGCPAGFTGDASVRCIPADEGSGSGKETGSNKNSNNYNNNNYNSNNYNNNHQNNKEPQPECQRHTECPDDRICLRSECVDPCRPGRRGVVFEEPLCGNNAECRVREHTPLCSCLQGFYGNPYVACLV